MAKKKRTNTTVSAIGSLLDTIGTVAKVELKDNPEALAEVDKMVADVKDSNITTSMELQDDSIEAYHEAEVEKGDAEQDAIEQEIEEMEQVENEPAEPANEPENEDDDIPF